MSQAATVDPERPRRLLEEVLSRSEFRGAPSPDAHPVTRFLDELLRAFGRAPDWVGDAITVVILAAAGVFLVWILAEGGLPGGLRRRRTPAPEVVESAGRVAAVELYRAGREHLRAGAFGEAVVHLFRAMIGRLTERELLLDDPSRTDREHLRDLRARPGESAVLATALPTFERVRYGNRSVGERQARDVLVAAEALFPEESP